MGPPNLQQIADDIVDFRGGQSRSVIRRHQRARLMLNASEFRFHERMKRAIRGLELQGKVVLISRDSCIRCSIGGCHYHRLAAGIKILIGLGDGTTNLVRRQSTGVARKIRSKESSFAIHRVTLRALCFSGEEDFASLRIAGERKRCAATLQTAEMVNHSFDLCASKRAEGGHASSRYSSANNLRHRLVG